MSHFHYASGILLTRVLWVKPGPDHPFVIVDAAMNDFLRPALYDAWHEFAAVQPCGAHMLADIVGPVYETGDTFARGRRIDRVAPADLCVVHTVGAYGATMASSYNRRALPAEVLVDGDHFAVIADRLNMASLARQHFASWQMDSEVALAVVDA